MIIPFYQLSELWNRKKIQNLGLEIDLSSAESGMESPSFFKALTSQIWDNVNAKNPGRVFVRYNLPLKTLLLQNFPDYYQPAYSDKISMLRMYLQQFEQANAMSRGRKLTFKKRYLKSLDSLQDKDGEKDILSFNQEIDSRLVDYLRTRYNDEYTLQYTASEKGILLVTDAKGYKENPQLAKLQFQIRKIFHDIRYKRVFAVDADQALTNYFKTTEGNSPKLVILCGQTKKNEYLSWILKVFDPFCKVQWLTAEDFKKTADDIFDQILPRLGSDYSYESLINDPDDSSREALPQNEIREFREAIAKLSREFSLKKYISIEYQLLEKVKKNVIQSQLNHLATVLEGLKISKDVIFTKLLEGPLE